ncbi:MAG: hypothetical protein HUJ68_05655, partial [Clostridia bacterium]|nr:hypothetical protein [Clostridia bacterium]
MDKNRAWSVLEQLSFVRESATPKELEAAKLILGECEKMGVEDVVIESFDVPYPEVKEAKFFITLPEQKEIYVTGLGKSGNTGDEGISGPLAYIHGGQDEFICDIEGKIV